MPGPIDKLYFQMSAVLAVGRSALEVAGPTAVGLELWLLIGLIGFGQAAGG